MRAVNSASCVGSACCWRALVIRLCSSLRSTFSQRKSQSSLLPPHLVADTCKLVSPPPGDNASRRLEHALASSIHPAAVIRLRSLTWVLPVERRQTELHRIAQTDTISPLQGHFWYVYLSSGSCDRICAHRGLWQLFAGASAMRRLHVPCWSIQPPMLPTANHSQPKLALSAVAVKQMTLSISSLGLLC